LTRESDTWILIHSAGRKGFDVC